MPISNAKLLTCLICKMLSFLFLFPPFVRPQVLHKSIKSGDVTQETLYWSGLFCLLIIQTSVIRWNLLCLQLMHHPSSPSISGSLLPRLTVMSTVKIVQVFISLLLLSFILICKKNFQDAI